jgi:AcrR family transcriptional regulator
MAGGRQRGGGRTGTPRGELTRIREGREQQDEEVRLRTMTAMLEVAGESGYRNVSVQDVIDRCGTNRVQFYRHFSSKDDCFAAAYEGSIERAVAEVAEAAGAASGWREGLRSALGAVAGFIERQPLVARGLVVEVHVAGGPALATRAEVSERAIEAIDLGRSEGAAGGGAPSLTAAFLLGAVESTLSAALARGEPGAFAEAIPGLTHMIVSAYLGEEAAAEDVAAASAA